MRKINNILWITLLCLLFIMNNVCHAGDLAITENIVNNVTTPGGAGDDTITFKDGYYEVKEDDIGVIESGKILQVAYGDLIGGGANDAVYIYSCRMGSSGAIYGLNAVVGKNGKAIPYEGPALGKISKINEIKISGNKILVDIIAWEPGKNEYHLKATYAIKKDKIVEVNRKELKLK